LVSASTSQRGCAVRTATIAIDLRAQGYVLALRASQDCVDEARGARMPHLARGLDGFGHGGVRGNLRVQELTQPDDCERAHIGIELLTRAREQALEQCIEAQVPANAVVNERAEQAALLARRLIVDHQCGVERASAQRHVRNDLRRGGANCSRTAHDPSTAPSRRCALRNSAADSALRPARCTRVRTQHPVACADVDTHGARCEHLARVA
jgi:hypothetical protein